MKIVFTVLFETPFWIGIIEMNDGNKYTVTKITFGSEPKDNEVYAFILNKWDDLNFSDSLERKSLEVIKRVNPKRKQREAKKAIMQSGVGTKAQQALKIQREKMMQERRTISKRKKQEEKEYQFQIKQEKKKQKHQGH